MHITQCALDYIGLNYKYIIISQYLVEVQTVVSCIYNCKNIQIPKFLAILDSQMKTLSTSKKVCKISTLNLKKNLDFRLYHKIYCYQINIKSFSKCKYVNVNCFNLRVNKNNSSFQALEIKENFHITRPDLTNSENHSITNEFKNFII